MFSDRKIHGIVMVMAIPLAGATWALCQPSTSPATDYQIKMARPVKVGETFHLTVSGSNKETRTVTMGGTPQTQRKELVYEVAGISETLKVDAKDETTEMAFTVDKCVVIDGNRRIDVAPKGVVVIVSAAGESKEIKPKDPNVALSQEAAQVLKDALSVKTGEGDDDDAFGTPQRQKIGDSWPVHGDFIAQQFNKMLGEGASLKKEDISGQVKLAGLTKAADIECLDLRMDMTIKNFAPPAPDPTAKVEKGEFTASMTGALPLDPAIPMLGGQRTLTSSITIRMKTPNGAEAVLEMKTENTSIKSDIPIRK